MIFNTYARTHGLWLDFKEMLQHLYKALPHR